MAGRSESPFVLWLADVSIGDVAAVGGKNASLGELIRALGPAGVRVPDGFATTADAYRAFLAEAGLEPELRRLIARFRAGEMPLEDCGHRLRALILASRLPASLANELRAAYARLGERIGTPDPAVAVRSSATAEDLPDASFAGQHETFLNVRGEAALLDACRRCFASLFTDRAISYREARGYDHLSVALSVGVQQMVRADLAGSGVMFTIETETGFPAVATISAAWGLGETIVQGAVNPDQYLVFKPLLETPGARPIIGKALGEKAIRMVYADAGGDRTRILPCTPDERRAFVLSDEEILELGRWAVAVERHYGRPMDLEWAKDGGTGHIYLVQARPETVHGTRAVARLRTFRLLAKADPVLAGAGIGHAIATGQTCIIRDASEIGDFRDGAILVTGATDPDWVPVMKRASGIITDRGGSTSHAAIVSRELGVPAVVGTGTATRDLADGETVTLACAAGGRGFVYRGALPYETEEIDLAAIPETRTRLMVNLADPGAGFAWWRLPARGVGLARMEFIIANLIKVHPMAVVRPEVLTDAERRRIEALAQGHPSPAAFFVDTLARGIASLAAPFYPQPAIVRLSDFKTNEYAHLLGGRAFEPVEENPMLGFRGAARYAHEAYREAFALECRALAMARCEIGFRNIVAMIPFCRTPEEADRVLALMADHGLRRGEDGLEVYMMCELPANVIRAGEFARRFDGFSIGSNDLAQLILGVDRDSELLADLFDERDPAVLGAIAEAIARAHVSGIPIGICGQAPSDHPEVARFLVGQGIDSISLNPDSFARTAAIVAEAERAAGAADGRG